MHLAGLPGLLIAMAKRSHMDTGMCPCHYDIFPSTILSVHCFTDLIDLKIIINRSWIVNLGKLQSLIVHFVRSAKAPNLIIHVILLSGDVNGKTWVPFMAAGPALLAFILVFLDDGITWHLINHPAHKLKHGDAYNYDTIVIGIMVLVNSMLGLPWLVAATVRSLNHIHAMAEKAPDGTILSVHETRLSALIIHVLCLATIFALDVLKLIPVPVLYGVFLFMGLVSLGSNQFWGRMLMLFMQPSKYPVQPYTQYMKAKKMHLFTSIQLFFFALLYTVKSIKTIAIAFPLCIALCIPIRLYVLPKIFTRDELILIDSDPQTVKIWITKHQAQEEAGDGNETKDDYKTEEIGDIETQCEDSPQKRRRVKRVKTMSCPTGALMFSEEPSALGPQLKPQMIVGENAGFFMMNEANANASTSAGSDDKPETDSKLKRRARPSREERRTLSCPVANNTFFHVELIKPNYNELEEGLPTLNESKHSQHSEW